MKCNKCNGEWMPPPGKNITVCPFCSEPMQTPSLETSSDNVIKVLAKEFGEKILLDSRLGSLVADKLQNKSPQMLKRIRLAINENIPKKMFDLKSANEQERTMRISVIADALTNDYGTEAETAYEIVNYFADALGYKLLANFDEEKANKKYEKAKSLLGEKRYTDAILILETLVKQNYAKAQTNLGYCYYKGQGVTQDYAKAVEWYRKAADQGHAQAQYNLGYCYYKGQGVTQDYAKASEWYRKAADQGHADAQNNLGACYYYGQGVTQDYAKAIEWYRKAADQGDADAQKKIDELKLRVI